VDHTGKVNEMIEETDFSVSSASFLFKILPPKDFGVFFIFPKSCPQKILEKPQEILMTPFSFFHSPQETLEFFEQPPNPDPKKLWINPKKLWRPTFASR
jgi:hypothetical protein